MINIFFLKDYEERKKGTTEILKYNKGDQAFIERQKASELILDGIVEPYTEHIERVGIKPDPETEKEDEVKKDKLKQKKSNRKYAVSKQAEKREKAIAI